MKTNKYGYVVVRLPEFVGELWNDKPRTILGLQGQNIYYLGLDRDPWWDLDELFFENQLDEQLKTVRQNIVNSKLQAFSPGICSDYITAKEVFELSNQSLARNELIVITAIDKSLEPICLTHDREVLGFDCYVDGYGSLLRMGIYQRTDIFCDFLPYINSNGLFSEFTQILKYVDAYSQRFIESNLEQIVLEQSYITIFLVSSA